MNFKSYTSRYFLEQKIAYVSSCGSGGFGTRVEDLDFLLPKVYIIKRKLNYEELFLPALDKLQLPERPRPSFSLLDSEIAASAALICFRSQSLTPRRFLQAEQVSLS